MFKVWGSDDEGTNGQCPLFLDVRYLWCFDFEISVISDRRFGEFFLSFPERSRSLLLPYVRS